jgi:hypothetical protein
MKSLAKFALAASLAAPSAAALGGDDGGASLSELAAAADRVLLAQVRDTDYLRRRGIPVSGSAYLATLIPYKGGSAGDLVEVYEKGLRDHECYFPDRTVFEEGRRYLLFLRQDPEQPDRYRGLPQGCAADVLVDRDNGYVVRMPVTGLQLTDRERRVLENLARPVTYSDRYAIVADEDLPPAQSDAMQAAGQIAPYPSGPQHWIYTLGVSLEEFRKLLRLDDQP